MIHYRGREVLSGRGEWLVKFDDVHGGPVLQARRIERVLQRIHPGLSIERQLGNTGLALLHAPDDLGLMELRELLQQARGFRRIEPNAILSSAAVPNDTLFGDQYYLHNTGGFGGTLDADIDAPEAWDLTTGSDEIVVGVIDSGVDYNHPDLAANIFINPGEVAGDGIDNDNNGFVDDVRGWDFIQSDNTPMDVYTHGTHVAGILGAVSNNAQGVAGVAWNVKILPIRILGDNGEGTIAGAVAALNYATMMRQKGVNLRLTNNSWGDQGYSQSLYNAVAAQTQADILVVAAAGNFANINQGDVEQYPYYPASFNLDGIISVGSTDRTDTLSSFSNYGAFSVDLMAPGSSVTSLLPGGITGIKSGTSMATPVVAGIAALAYSVSAPSISSAAIRSAILAGADPVAGLAGKSVTGARANARNTLLQLPLQVLHSTPAANAIVGAPPTSFALSFSQAVDPASAAPADLAVNGIPADSLNWNNPREAVFGFDSTPIVAEGPQTVALNAGAVQRTGDLTGNAPYNATLYYDTLAMQATSTLPAAGSVPPPLTALDINFNEAVHAASLDAGDLQLSRGQSVAVQLIDADTVRFVLSGLEQEGPVQWTIPKGAIADSFANASGPFSGSIDVDVQSAAWARPWTALLPAAAGAFRSNRTGVINNNGDSDEFFLDLDPGQMLCAVINGAAGLRPSVLVKDPSGAVLAQHQATAGTVLAYLPGVQAAQGGMYSVVVSSDGLTSGSYTATLTLNSTVELETLGTGINDLPAGAQNIGIAFAPLPRGGDFVAVQGQGEHPTGYLPTEVEPNNSLLTGNDASGNFAIQQPGLYQIAIDGDIPVTSDSDYYNLGQLQPGDVLTAALNGTSTPRGTLYDPYLQLYRGTPGNSTVVDDNDDGGVDRDSLLYRFPVSVADNYYLRVRPYPNSPLNPDQIGSYDLAISLERTGAAPGTSSPVSVESEPNDELLTATNVSSGWRAITHASVTSGSLEDLDHDFLRYSLNAGDVVSVRVTGQGSLKPRFSLMDPSGAVMALDDGTSTIDAFSSAIFGWKVPANGLYSLEIWPAQGNGAYTARLELASLTPPAPAPLSVVDVYAVPLVGGQSLQLQADTTVATTLQLLSPGGQVLASTSGTGSPRLELAVVPAPGSYLVRVTSAPDAPYILSLARSATLERTDNHTLGTAQPMGSNAVGYVDPYEPDVYSFDVAGNHQFQIRAFIPAAGPGDPANSVQIAMELFDPANNVIATSVDGAVNGTAMASGQYKVRVRSVAGAGAYRLSFADFSQVMAGTDGNDTFHLRLDASGEHLEIFRNAPITGEWSYRLPKTFLSGLALSGGAGDDVLEIDATGVPLPVTFFAGEGQNRVDVDPSAPDGQLYLTIGGTVFLNAPVLLHALSLGAGARLTMSPGLAGPLEVNQLTLHSTAEIDLKDNDLVIHASGSELDSLFAVVKARLTAGRNTTPSLWAGPGIISSMASSTTGLGIRKYANSILVKYTWTGDADLNGTVDIDDYFKTDMGLALSRSGWEWGDFNYSSGSPNADDFFLIDQAFLGQTAAL